MALEAIVTNLAGIDLPARYPWNGGKYDPAVSFMGHEVGNYIQYFLNGVKYIVFTTDTLSVHERVINEGYELDDVRYVSIFSMWKDGRGKSILVDASSGVTQLGHIGIHTHCRVWEESVKAAKYINRLISPSAIGTEVILGHQIADGQFILNSGEILKVQYVDLKTLDSKQKAAVDGMITVSPAGNKKLGGKGYVPRRVTMSTPHALGKGHMLVKEDQQADVIIWGPKTLVSTSCFVFNDMGQLHSGKPRTDIQSIINFQMAPLLVQLGDDFMRWVYKSAKSENGLVKAFRSSIKAILNPFKDQVDREVSLAEEVDLERQRQEAFPLLRFIEKGISPFSMGWLYRRVIRHFMEKVMVVEKGKIPMAYGNGEGVATSAYVMGDPTMITKDGKVDVNLTKLKRREMCNPNLPDGIEVVLYRQPSGTRNEFVVVTNQHIPELMKYKGMDVFFVGADADEIFSICGGADNDDNFIQVHDPAWVAHFKTLTPYPEVEPLETDLSDYQQSKLAADMFEFEQSLSENGIIPDVRYYGKAHAEFQIRLARKQQAGIGVVVSAGFSDTVLSNDKEFIYEWMNSEGFVEEAKQFLKRYPYQMRKLLTYLEVVIDGAVKDPAQLAALGDVKTICANYHKAAQFYPRFLAHRVPKSKKDKGDYMLVDTTIDVAFDTLNAHRKGLEKAFKKVEVSLVKPVPAEIKTLYAQNDVINEIVFGVKGTDQAALLPLWKTLWSKSADRGTMGVDYKSVTNVIEDFLKDYKPDLPEIAWKLYCYYYSGYKFSREEADGSTRGHSDGLLGVKSISNALLDMLDDHGYTGQVYTCEFDSYVSVLSSVQMMVDVKSGLVYRAATKQCVGMSMKCPDGHYPMIAGSIEVRPAAEFLQAPDQHELEEIVSQISKEVAEIV